MSDSLLLFILPPLLLIPAMGLTSMIRSKHALGSELKRKALHASIGISTLAVPIILNEPWTIACGLILTLAWMTAVRILPCLQRRFGSVLRDCKRHSLGEYYFALAIAGLLLVTVGHPLLFAIPVLILSLADSAAAIAGQLYPVHELSGLMRGKTVAGCSTFFIVAATICMSVLGICTDLPNLQIVLAALVVATATTLAEAACRRGLDNLAVPLVAWLVLRMLDLSRLPAAAVAMDTRRLLQTFVEGAP